MEEILIALRAVGLDSVVQALTRLGDEGRKAFDNLQSATRGVQPALNRIGQAINAARQRMSDFAATARQAAGQVVQSFNQMASAVGGLVTRFGTLAGAAGVIGGLFGGATLAAIQSFADSALRSTEALGDLAEQVGETIESISTLQSAFARAGVDSSSLENIFRRLAVATENSWTDIQKAVREGSAAVIGAYAAMEGAAISLARAQENLRNVSRDLALQQRSDALSVRDAELQLQRVQAQRTITVSPEAIRQLGREQAISNALAEHRLSIDQAQLRVDQARIQQSDNLANAGRRQQEAAVAAANAELQLREQQRKLVDAYLNDINRVIQHVDALAKGVDTSSLEINKSVDNIVKGIIGVAAAGEGGIDKLVQDINNLAAAPPKATAVLNTLADVLKNTESETQRMAIAVRLFGRGVSQDLVAFLAQGSEAIQRHRDEIKNLGLTYRQEDADIANSWKASRGQLDDTLKVVRDRLGSAFGPASIQLMDDFRQALINNFGSVEEFVKRIVAVIEPAAKAIGNLLKGITSEQFAEDQARAGLLNDPFTQRVISWQKSLEGFAASVRRVVDDVVKFFTEGSIRQAFDSVLKQLDRLAAGVNKIFGTNFSASDLGIGLLVGHFSGLNQAIVQVGFAVGALAAAFIGLGLAIGGFPALIAGAIAAVVLFGQEIGKFIADITKGTEFEAFGKGLETVIRSVQALFREGFVGLFNELHEQSSKEGTSIGQAIADAIIAGFKGLGNAIVNEIVSEIQNAVRFIVTKAPELLGPVGTVIRAALVARQIAGGGEGADLAKSLGIENIGTAAERAGEVVRNALNVPLSETDSRLQQLNADADEVDRSFKAIVDESSKLNTTASQTSSLARNIAGGFQSILDRAIAAAAGASQLPKQLQAATAATIPLLANVRGLNEGLQFSSAARNVRTVESALEGVRSVAASTNQQAGQLAQNLTPAQQLNQNIQSISTGLTNLQQPLTQVKTNFDEAARGATQIPTALTNATSALTGFQSALNSAFVGANQAINTFLSFIDQIPGKITAALAEVVPTLSTPFVIAAQIAEAAWLRVIAVIEAAARAGAARPAGAVGGGGGGGGGEGFASGGGVRGRGTSTSDSILAWLSNGEWVIQARAVRALMSRFGSNVMHLLNQGIAPSGFSRGGLAYALSAASRAPRYARGGPALSNEISRSARRGAASFERNLGTLTLVGDRGQKLGTVFATEDVVRGLHHYSILNALSSGGRKPSSYRG